ncbi:plexin-C1-like [Carcharodon carcharias]|uniref:plexin-C1-like n=1 Tax=Carcharodon carcharias TaxID=13397 RepID=UPI001B7E10A7|nr:plexin-C1-like [Carcharodon carcharias]
MNQVKDVSLYFLLFNSLVALAIEVNPESLFEFSACINNIAVSAGGRVFVATKNSLYQLNQSLGLEVLERTGPHLDGPCEEQQGCCIKWEEKANVNKILIVDENKKQILTCGTLRLGACEVRQLHNISQYKSDQRWNVASIYMEASTVALLVKAQRKDYLLTATTSTEKSSRFVPSTCRDNSSYKGDFDYTITLRDLSGKVGDETFLGFTEAEFGNAVVKLNQKHQSVELQYIQGFQWQKHIYILHNAINLSAEIIRMNIEDYRTTTVSSFSQATLLCPQGKKQVLKVLSSALITLSPSQAFMVAIFSGQGRSKYSPLCFYNLTQFNGYKKGRKYYFQIENVVESNEDLNPIHSTSVFEHPGLLSVSASVVQGRIVLFLGTEEGLLIKLIMDRNLAVIRPIALFELENEAPIRQVTFDRLDANYLYITAEKTVNRIKVAACAQYSSCTDCLSVQDPYCGWYILEKRCSFVHEYENSSNPSYCITTKGGSNSCPNMTLKPSAIDHSFKNTKLFTVKLREKFSNFMNENATCTLRNARNNEVICTAKYTTQCSCRVSNNTYTQLENQPDPVTINASVEFRSLNFTTRFTVHNCYKIATARFNNAPCSECIKSGCHWCAVEHRCTPALSCNGNITKQFCPQIDGVKLNPSSAKDLNIFLKHAKMLKDANIGLNCTFDGKSEAANWINDSVIQCVRPQFVAERRIIPVNLVDSKNSGRVIDNPNNITVYSCDVQKPGCVFCSPERICKESIVKSIKPQRVSSSRRATVTIVGFGLNVGSCAVLQVKGMSDYVTAKSSNCAIENNTLIRCVLPETTHGKKTACLLYDSERDCVANRTAKLEYISNILITKIHPTVSWASGGRSITISGRNLDVVEQMQAWLTGGPKKPADCSVIDSTWVCDSPPAQGRETPSNYSMLFNVSGSKEKVFNVTYHEDPEFYNFKTTTDDKRLLITVMRKKDNLQLHKSEFKISVRRGKDERSQCNVIEVTEDKIKCVLITSDTSASEIEVKVGKYEKVLISQLPGKSIFVILIVIPIMLLVFIIIYFWATRRKAKQFSQSLYCQMESLESQFRNQIREGFVELQTEGSGVHLIDNYGSIPFLDYKHFAAQTFFPEGNGEYVPNFVGGLIVTAPLAPEQDKLNEEFNALYNFLSNEQFLVTLIHNLEQQKDFSIKDQLVLSDISAG